MDMKRRTLSIAAAALLAAAVSPLAILAEAALPAMSEQDRADIARVEAYLNGLSTMESRFIQVNSLGAFAEGQLYLDRPGQMRFEYDDPHPILMIANGGGSLLYYNKELKQSTFLPLSSTPLRFIADGDISLSDNAQVTRITREDSTLSITLTDSAADFDGEVTLVFSDHPLSLRKWQITDPEGVVIQVGLINPEFGGKIDPKQFDYGELDVYGFRGKNKVP